MLSLKDFKANQIGQLNSLRGGKDIATNYTTTNTQTGSIRSGSDVKSRGHDTDGNWYNFTTYDDGRVYDATTGTWS